MRHKAREIAFHLLFEADYRLEEFSGDIEGEMKRYIAVHGHVDEPTRSFAAHLVSGVLRYRESLDATISHSGSNWRLDRIGLVEKTLLRMATFELRDPDDKGEIQPVEIVIDEAIELAKIYGPDEAPAFINGVLDALAPCGDRRARRGIPAPGDGAANVGEA